MGSEIDIHIHRIDSADTGAIRSWASGCSVRDNRKDGGTAGRTGEYFSYGEVQGEFGSMGARK